MHYILAFNAARALGLHLPIPYIWDTLIGRVKACARVGFVRVVFARGGFARLGFARVGFARLGFTRLGLKVVYPTPEWG